MKKLKFYTQKDWLPSGIKHVPMLFPFWGKIIEPENSPHIGRFDELANNGFDFMELVDDLFQADVILLPFEYRFDKNLEELYDKLAQLSQQYNLKVLVFFNSDENTEINLTGGIIFRTSYKKSIKAKDVFAYPAWSVDFFNYTKSGKGYYKSKSANPEIGYCGYVNGKHLNQNIFSVYKSLKKYFSNNISPYEFGAALRGKAVNRLQNSKRIKTNFIFRNGFWAEGERDKNIARIEYAENMLQNMYTLVMRGSGNFSYRLYEVMSCGRIPVFVDTDSPLPFDEFIFWKDYVVWIDYKKRHQIGEILLNFHNNKTEEELIRMQKQNRLIYEEWLSPVGFHKKINLYF